MPGSNESGTSVIELTKQWLEKNFGNSFLVIDNLDDLDELC